MCGGLRFATAWNKAGKPGNPVVGIFSDHLNCERQYNATPSELVTREPGMAA